MAERGSEEWWRDYLTRGHRLEGVARALFPLLPSNPRCKVCRVPFKGFGHVLRLFGWSPSSKNPTICGLCSGRLPAGGAEVEVAVLVADVRGYTTLSENTPPMELAATMSRLFDLLTRELVAHDALIDKYMGDGLQALFISGVAGPDYEARALQAALSAQRALLDASQDVRTLPVGIAIHAGRAFVGNVGAQGMVDLTAMGDVVNIANRLQGFAAGGQIVLGEDLYQRHRALLGELRPIALSLKGKKEPYAARISS